MLEGGSRCYRCGREVIPLESGLTKKLVGRGATRYLCKSCLAAHFGCTEEDLDRAAEEYRKQGCALFS